VGSVGRLRSRRSARLAANPGSAVYGTIVATAVVAAASTHGQGPGRVAVVTVVTLVVFWLSHVYSQVLEHQLRGRRFRFAAVPATMARELAMIEAPALSVVFLLLGAVGLLDGRLAVNLALANGVAQLLGWGIAAGRRLGWSWPAACAVGLVDATFGLLVVALKTVVH
jgi:hypothetical protein